MERFDARRKPQNSISVIFSEIGKCPLNVVYEQLHNTIITVVLELNPRPSVKHLELQTLPMEFLV